MGYMYDFMESMIPFSRSYLSVVITTDGKLRGILFSLKRPVDAGRLSILIYDTVFHFISVWSAFEQ